MTPIFINTFITSADLTEIAEAISATEINSLSSTVCITGSVGFSNWCLSSPLLSLFFLEGFLLLNLSSETWILCLLFLDLTITLLFSSFTNFVFAFFFLFLLLSSESLSLELSSVDSVLSDESNLTSVSACSSLFSFEISSSSLCSLSTGNISESTFISLGSNFSVTWLFFLEKTFFFLTTVFVFFSTKFSFTSLEEIFSSSGFGAGEFWLFLT